MLTRTTRSTPSAGWGHAAYSLAGHYIIAAYGCVFCAVLLNAQHRATVALWLLLAC